MGNSSKQKRRGRPEEGRIEDRNGRFRARVFLGGARHNKTFDTREQAEDWLRDLERKHAAGKLPKHLRATAITLGDGMDRRLEMMEPGKYRDDTAKKIEYLKATEEALCNKPLADIDAEEDIEAFIGRRRAQGRAAATINRDLTIMRTVFRLAATKWGCAQLANPVSGITAGKERQRERRPSPAEMNALARAAITYAANPKSTVPILHLIEFAASSGLRANELGNLLWADVDWHKCAVCVRRGKGGKRRTVALFPAALELLKLLCSGQNPGVLIFGSTSAINRAWKRVRELAAAECPSVMPGGYDNLRLHDFRHEAISRLFERTDLQDGAISDISGHEDPRSMWRYKHIRTAALAPRLAEAEKRYLAERQNSPFGTNPFDAAVEQSIGFEGRKAAWRAASNCRETLQGLVNAMPISQVARIYAVSDVAIHKACAKLAVVKRPVGHWARERAAQVAA